MGLTNIISNIREAASVNFQRGRLPLFILLPVSVLIVGIGLFLLLNRFSDHMLLKYVSSEGLLNQVIKEDAPKDKQYIAALFTPEVKRWEEKIWTWSKRWDVDPNLIATVMQIESCGNPQARSGAGAIGLFQVMPYHFAAGDDPYKPGINALRGIAYLNSAMDARNGDVRLALAGYNGGINGAMRPESAWQAETVRYVYWGDGIFADAIAGNETSEVLDDWLSSGGSSPCIQAAQN